MKARRTPFAMVPLWVYDHPEVTSTVLRVYLGLAALAYDRAAKRTVVEIAERAGLGKTATYDALAILDRVGAVEKEGRDAWFLPLDEPVSDSATAENDSATADESSATAESAVIDTSSTEVPREEENARALDARAQFDDHFWPAYPARNGRKIGKAEAFGQWEKLPIEDRRAALKGARIMAADVNAGRTLPPDAHRWLRKRTWEDWQEPTGAVPSPTRGGRQTMTEAHDVIAAARAAAVNAGLFPDEREDPQHAIG